MLIYHTLVNAPLVTKVISVNRTSTTAPLTVVMETGIVSTVLGRSRVSVTMVTQVLVVKRGYVLKITARMEELALLVMKVKN